MSMATGLKWYKLIWWANKTFKADTAYLKCNTKAGFTKSRASFFQRKINQRPKESTKNSLKNTATIKVSPQIEK